MEQQPIEHYIGKIKSLATNQTEFVHGLLLHLLQTCQKMDIVIEELGNEEIKEELAELRQDLPNMVMAIASEVELINKNKNQLS